MGGAGAVEKVVLVDPVVRAEPDEYGHGAGGNQINVQKGEPHHLQNLSVALADAVLVVSHEQVGLLLRNEVSALVHPPLEFVGQLVRVDQPDQRHQHR